MIPQPFPGPGEKSDKAGFDQTLEIESDLVLVSDPFPPSGRSDDDDVIEARDQVQNLLAFLLDGPGNPGLRMFTAQRSERRQGMNDIAQRARPDDQKIFHALIFSRRPNDFHFSQDPRNNFRRGPDLRPAGDGDPSAVSEDGLSFRDRLFRIIRAFGMDIRLQRHQDVFDVRLIKNSDKVHAGERGENISPLLLGKDGSSFAFELPDGRVAVEGHDQDVALFFGSLQIPDMAGMDQVEAAVGQDDDLAYFPFPVNDCSQLGERLEFLQFSAMMACLSSSGVTVAVPFFMTTMPPA